MNEQEYRQTFKEDQAVGWKPSMLRLKHFMVMSNLVITALLSNTF